MITPSCDGQVYQHLQYSTISIFSLKWLKSGVLLTDTAIVSHVAVYYTTCTKPAELKTWQHVSTTTSHHQAKNRMKSWYKYSQWLCTLWMYQDFVLSLGRWWLVVAETCCQVFNSADLIHVVLLNVTNWYIITAHNRMAAIKILVSQSDSSMQWKLMWPGSLKFWQTSPPQCGVTTKEWKQCYLYKWS